MWVGLVIQVLINVQRTLLQAVTAPIMAGSQAALPIAVVLVVGVIRQESPPSISPPCTYSSQSTPTDGSLLFIQSFACNVNNSCESPLDKDPKGPKQQARERMKKLQNSLNPFVGNSDNLKVLTNVKDLLTTADDFNKLLNDPDIKQLISFDFRIGNFFANESEVLRLLTEGPVPMDEKSAKSLLDARININQFFNLAGYVDMKQVVCSPNLLKKYLTVNSSAQLTQISTELCNMNNSNIPDLVKAIQNQFDLAKILKLGTSMLNLTGYFAEAEALSDISRFLNFGDLFKSLQFNNNGSALGNILGLFSEIMTVVSDITGNKAAINWFKIASSVMSKFEQFAKTLQIKNWNEIKLVIDTVIKILGSFSSQTQLAATNQTLTIQQIRLNQQLVFQKLELSFPVLKSFLNIYDSISINTTQLSSMMTTILISPDQMEEMFCGTPGLKSALIYSSSTTKEAFNKQIATLCQSDQFINILKGNFNADNFTQLLSQSTNLQKSLSSLKWDDLISVFANLELVFNDQFNSIWNSVKSALLSKFIENPTYDNFPTKQIVHILKSVIEEPLNNSSDSTLKMIGNLMMNYAFAYNDSLNTFEELQSETFNKIYNDKETLNFLTELVRYNQHLAQIDNELVKLITGSHKVDLELIIQVSCSRLTGPNLPDTGDNPVCYTDHLAKYQQLQNAMRPDYESALVKLMKRYDLQKVHAQNASIEQLVQIYHSSEKIIRDLVWRQNNFTQTISKGLNLTEPDAQNAEILSRKLHYFLINGWLEKSSVYMTSIVGRSVDTISPQLKLFSISMRICSEILEMVNNLMADMIAEKNPFNLLSKFPALFDLSKSIIAAMKDLPKFSSSTNNQKITEAFSQNLEKICEQPIDMDSILGTTTINSLVESVCKFIQEFPNYESQVLTQLATIAKLTRGEIQSIAEHNSTQISQLTRQVDLIQVNVAQVMTLSFNMSDLETLFMRVQNEIMTQDLYRLFSSQLPDNKTVEQQIDMYAKQFLPIIVLVGKSMKLDVSNQDKFIASLITSISELLVSYNFDELKAMFNETEKTLQFWEILSEIGNFTVVLSYSSSFNTLKMQTLVYNKLIEIPESMRISYLCNNLTWSEVLLVPRGMTFSPDDYMRKLCSINLITDLPSKLNSIFLNNENQSSVSVVEFLPRLYKVMNELPQLFSLSADKIFSQIDKEFQLSASFEIFGKFFENGAFGNDTIRVIQDQTNQAYLSELINSSPDIARYTITTSHVQLMLLTYLEKITSESNFTLVDLFESTQQTQQLVNFLLNNYYDLYLLSTINTITIENLISMSSSAILQALCGNSSSLTWRQPPITSVCVDCIFKEFCSIDFDAIPIEWNRHLSPILMSYQDPNPKANITSLIETSVKLYNMQSQFMKMPQLQTSFLDKAKDFNTDMAKMSLVISSSQSIDVLKLIWNSLDTKSQITSFASLKYLTTLLQPRIESLFNAGNVTLNTLLDIGKSISTEIETLITFNVYSSNLGSTKFVSSDKAIEVMLQPNVVKNKVCTGGFNISHYLVVQNVNGDRESENFNFLVCQKDFFIDLAYLLVLNIDMETSPHSKSNSNLTSSADILFKQLNNFINLYLSSIDQSNIANKLSFNELAREILNLIPLNNMSNPATYPQYAVIFDGLFSKMLTSDQLNFYKSIRQAMFNVTRSSVSWMSNLVNNALSNGGIEVSGLFTDRERVKTLFNTIFNNNSVIVDSIIKTYMDYGKAMKVVEYLGSKEASQMLCQADVFRKYFQIPPQFDLERILSLACNNSEELVNELSSLLDVQSLITQISIALNSPMTGNNLTVSDFKNDLQKMISYITQLFSIQTVNLNGKDLLNILQSQLKIINKTITDPALTDPVQIMLSFAKYLDDQSKSCSNDTLDCQLQKSSAMIAPYLTNIMREMKEKLLIISSTQSIQLKTLIANSTFLEDILKLLSTEPVQHLVTSLLESETSFSKLLYLISNSSDAIPQACADIRSYFSLSENMTVYEEALNRILCDPFNATSFVNKLASSINWKKIQSDMNQVLDSAYYNATMDAISIFETIQKWSTGVFNSSSLQIDPLLNQLMKWTDSQTWFDTLFRNIQGQMMQPGFGNIGPIVDQLIKLLPQANDPLQAIYLLTEGIAKEIHRVLDGPITLSSLLSTDSTFDRDLKELISVMPTPVQIIQHQPINFKALLQVGPTNDASIFCQGDFFKNVFLPSSSFDPENFTAEFCQLSASLQKRFMTIFNIETATNVLQQKATAGPYSFTKHYTIILELMAKIQTTNSTSFTLQNVPSLLKDLENLNSMLANFGNFSEFLSNPQILTSQTGLLSVLSIWMDEPSFKSSIHINLALQNMILAMLKHAEVVNGSLSLESMFTDMNETFAFASYIVAHMPEIVELLSNNEAQMKSLLSSNDSLSTMCNPNFQLNNVSQFCGNCFRDHICLALQKMLPEINSAFIQPFTIPENWSSSGSNFLKLMQISSEVSTKMTELISRVKSVSEPSFWTYQVQLKYYQFSQMFINDTWMSTISGWSSVLNLIPLDNQTESLYSIKVQIMIYDMLIAKLSQDIENGTLNIESMFQNSRHTIDFTSYVMSHLPELVNLAMTNTAQLSTLLSSNDTISALCHPNFHLTNTSDFCGDCFKQKLCEKFPLITQEIQKEYVEPFIMAMLNPYGASYARLFEQNMKVQELIQSLISQTKEVATPSFWTPELITKFNKFAESFVVNQTWYTPMFQLITVLSTVTMNNNTDTMYSIKITTLIYDIMIKKLSLEIKNGVLNVEDMFQSMKHTLEFVNYLAANMPQIVNLALNNFQSFIDLSSNNDTLTALCSPNFNLRNTSAICGNCFKEFICEKFPLISQEVQVEYIQPFISALANPYDASYSLLIEKNKKLQELIQILVAQTKTVSPPSFWNNETQMNYDRFFKHITNESALLSMFDPISISLNILKNLANSMGNNTIQILPNYLDIILKSANSLMTSLQTPNITLSTLLKDSSSLTTLLKLSEQYPDMIGTLLNASVVDTAKLVELFMNPTQLQVVACNGTLKLDAILTLPEGNSKSLILKLLCDIKFDMEMAIDLLQGFGLQNVLLPVTPPYNPPTLETNLRMFVQLVTSISQSPVTIKLPELHDTGKLMTQLSLSVSHLSNPTVIMQYIIMSEAFLEKLLPQTESQLYQRIQGTILEISKLLVTQTDSFVNQIIGNGTVIELHKLVNDATALEKLLEKIFKTPLTVNETLSTLLDFQKVVNLSITLSTLQMNSKVFCDPQGLTKLFSFFPQFDLSEVRDIACNQSDQLVAQLKDILEAETLINKITHLVNNGSNSVSVDVRQYFTLYQTLATNIAQLKQVSSIKYKELDLTKLLTYDTANVLAILGATSKLPNPIEMSSIAVRLLSALLNMPLTCESGQTSCPNPVTNVVNPASYYMVIVMRAINKHLSALDMTREITLGTFIKDANNLREMLNIANPNVSQAIIDRIMTAGAPLDMIVDLITGKENITAYICKILDTNATAHIKSLICENPQSLGSLMKEFQNVIDWTKLNEELAKASKFSMTDIFKEVTQTIQFFESWLNNTPSWNWKILENNAIFDTNKWTSSGMAWLYPIQTIFWKSNENKLNSAAVSKLMGAILKVSGAGDAKIPEVVNQMSEFALTFLNGLPDFQSVMNTNQLVTWLQEVMTGQKMMQQAEMSLIKVNFPAYLSLVGANSTAILCDVQKREQLFGPPDSETNIPYTSLCDMSRNNMLMVQMLPAAVPALQSLNKAGEQDVIDVMRSKIDRYQNAISTLVTDTKWLYAASGDVQLMMRQIGQIFTNMSADLRIENITEMVCKLQIDILSLNLTEFYSILHPIFNQAHIQYQASNTGISIFNGLNGLICGASSNNGSAVSDVQRFIDQLDLEVFNNINNFTITSSNDVCKNFGRIVDKSYATQTMLSNTITAMITSPPCWTDPKRLQNFIDFLNKEIVQVEKLLKSGRLINQYLTNETQQLLDQLLTTDVKRFENVPTSLRQLLLHKTVDEATAFSTVQKYFTVDNATAKEILETAIVLNMAVGRSLTFESLGALLCNESYLTTLLILPSSINATHLSAMLCANSSLYIPSIRNTFSIAEAYLQLSNSILKNADLGQLVDLFSLVETVIKSLQSFVSIGTDLKNGLDLSQLPDTILKIESLFLNSPINDIIKNIDLLMSKIQSLKSNPLISDLFQSLDDFLKLLNSFKLLSQYFPIKVPLQNFFANKTEIETILSQKFGLSPQTIEAIMASVLSSQEVLKLASRVDLPGILCNSSRFNEAFTVNATGGANSIVTQLCQNWSVEQINNLTRELLARASLGDIVYKGISFGISGLLNRSNIDPKKLSQTINQLSTIKQFLNTVVSTIGDVGSSITVKPGASLTETFQNALCGVGSSNSSSNSTGRSSNQSLRRRKRQVLSQDEQCRRLITDDSESWSAGFLWKTVKPMMTGKILVTPDKPIIKELISQANSTFAELANLKTFSEVFTNSSSTSDLSNTTALLEEALKSPIISGILVQVLGSDPNNLVDSLKSISSSGLTSESNSGVLSLLSKMIEFMNCVSFDRFVFYPSEEDAEYKKQINPMGDLHVNVFMAVNFKDIEKDFELPKHVKYYIRVPSDRATSTRFLHDMPMMIYQPTNALQKQYLHGFTQLQELIDRAIIKIHGANFTVPPFEINEFPSGCRNNDNFLENIGKHALSIMIVFSWISLIIVFVKDGTYERDNKLERPLHVMGSRSGLRWLSWFFQCLISSLVVCVLLTLVMKYGGVFPKTDPLIMFLLLVDFAFAMIMFSFLAASIFNKTVMAVMFGLLFYLISYVPFTIIMSDTFLVPDWSKKLSMVSAASCLCWTGQYITTLELAGIGLQWQHIRSTAYVISVEWIFIILLLDGIGYFLIGWYIRNVFPGKHGVQQPFYFPFMANYWGYVSKSARRRHQAVQKQGRANSDSQVDINNIYLTEGSSSSDSRSSDGNISVIIENLTKIYKRSKKPALDNLSLTLHKNEVTVLLGPNSAGKSTTINILTGLLSPTSGRVLVEGIDPTTESAALSSVIGFCPQHDVFYDYMTVKQNLNFFAGLNSSADRKTRKLMVKEMLMKTNMESMAKVKASNLSGGQKRRLSVAIAFIGDSKVIVLDEPTSGVDPTARRQIWDLVTTYKEGRAILFCTHFMDEADIIGDKIAILKEGKVLAYDTPINLKAKYGCSYDVTVRLNQGERQQVMESSESFFKEIQNLFPMALKRPVRENELKITVPMMEQSVKKQVNLFLMLEEAVDELRIRDFTVSYTSLEQVFMRLIGNWEEEVSNTDSDPSTSHKGKGKLGNSTHSDMDDFDKKELHQDDLFYEPSKEYSSSSCAQFLILSRKRLLHYIRNWQTYIMMIIFPIIFVALSLSVMQIRPSINESSLLLSTTMHGPEAKSFYRMGDAANSFEKRMMYSMTHKPTIGTACMTGNKEVYPFTKCDATQSNEFSKVSVITKEEEEKYSKGSCPCDAQGYAQCSSKYDRPRPTPKLELVTTDLISQLDNEWQNDTSDYIIRINANKLERIDVTFGGWEFLGEDSIKLWYNPKGYHGLPAYINSFSNMALRAIMMGNVSSDNVTTDEWKDYGITTYAHPLETDKGLKLDHMSSKTADMGIAILFILAFCFIPSTAILYPIQENQNQEKLLQTICGVHRGIYWFVAFLWDFMIFLIPIGFTLLIVFIYKIEAFSDENNILAIFIILVLFAWAVLPLSYLLSTVFKSVNVGFVGMFSLGFFVAVVFLVISFLLEFLLGGVDTPMSVRIVNYVLMALSPYFTLGHSIILLTKNGILKTIYRAFEPDYDIDNFTLDQLLPHMISLAAHGVLYFILLMIIESKSVRRKNCSPVCCKSCTKESDDEASNFETKDEGVIKEKSNIASNSYYKFNDPLIIEDLKKTFYYGRRKISAVKDLSFGLKKQECFGLVGANGAGKTTTFKIITGLVKQDRGNVTVLPLNQSPMGYCPQTDPLDPQLTMLEHLQIYGKLKGVHKMEEQIHSLLHSLNLEVHKNKRVKELSGGTKRKLSLAISLLGHPQLVLLDEPTSGLDPASKRLVWKVLARASQSSAILVTSHSMEEVEAVCNRIAIMVKGSFKCLGSMNYLQATYGSNYNLQIWCRPHKMSHITSFMTAKFPGTRLKANKGNLMEFSIPLSVKLSELYLSIENHQHEMEIVDFAASQTSLEKIFLQFAEGDNRPNTKKANSVNQLFAKPESILFDDKIETYSTVSSNNRPVSNAYTFL